MMKPRKSFYNLPYIRAMKVAKQVASLSGAMDWELYGEWMSMYETVRVRRLIKDGKYPTTSDGQKYNGSKPRGNELRQIALKL